MNRLAIRYLLTLYHPVITSVTVAVAGLPQKTESPSTNVVLPKIVTPGDGTEPVWSDVSLATASAEKRVSNWE